MDDDEDLSNSLNWHALNYRTAAVQHAQGMWVELEACVNRLIAAAVAAEQARCIDICAQYFTIEGIAQDIAVAIRAKEPKA